MKQWQPRTFGDHGFHRSPAPQRAAHIAGLGYSVLLLFLPGSKAYRERTDLYRRHGAAELAEVLAPATRAKESLARSRPSTGRATSAGLTARMAEGRSSESRLYVGPHAHTQLGIALDALNANVGGLLPWAGDDMASGLIGAGLIVALACAIGGVWCCCRSARPADNGPHREKDDHAHPHVQRPQHAEDGPREGEPRHKTDSDLVAELQAIAHKLPGEVKKCPKHLTTSLFKGLLDRYIAIVANPAPEAGSEVERWRRAHLTYWGSKNEYRQKANPKGHLPIAQIGQVRIDHEMPSIWMAGGSKAVILSHKHNAEDELILILERKSAEQFYATLRQYMDVAHES